MIAEQLRKNWALLTLIFTILGAGYAARGQIDKLTRPVEGIHQALQEMNDRQARTEEGIIKVKVKLDSVGKYTELRFIGNDYEIQMLKQAIENNKQLILHGD